MKQRFKLDDSVIARIAQILQEAILMGVDVVDLLRQIEVVSGDDPETNGILFLSEQYKLMVDQHHQDLLSAVDALKNVN